MDTEPPFRFHNPKPDRPRESFFSAVAVPAAMAVVKGIAASALLLILFLGVHHD